MLVKTTLSELPEDLVKREKDSGSKKILSVPLLPFLFLCLESTAVLAKKKKKKNQQCGADLIAMYVFLFFSQMRKVNAGG